jgi:hypothetical protein
MKHIWVVESSGGRKWSPVGGVLGVFVYASFSKLDAEERMKASAKSSPGLKWRVAKYVRGEK